MPVLTIQKLIKDQKVIHFSSSVNSIAEDAITSAYISEDGMYEDN